MEREIFRNHYGLEAIYMAQLQFPYLLSIAKLTLPGACIFYIHARKIGCINEYSFGVSHCIQFTVINSAVLKLKNTFIFSSIH